MFSIFLLEISTQYMTKVRVLRTDNALEFTQKAIEGPMSGS